MTDEIAIEEVSLRAVQQKMDEAFRAAMTRAISMGEENSCLEEAGHQKSEGRRCLVRSLAISGITTMRVEEKAFLTAAVAALPRIAEIISGYAPDDRAGALEIAQRHFIEAARDYGCTDIAAQSRVSIVMKRLRSQVERQSASEEQLRALLQSITRSN